MHKLFIDSSLFRDIRNDCRKINESSRRRRYNEDLTGKFDKITSDSHSYFFDVEIGFIRIAIIYNTDHEKAYMETGIDGNRSMNDLVRNPELLREIADFMEPLLDQNGKIDTKVLDKILANNNL